MSTVRSNLGATDTINSIRLEWNSPVGKDLIFVLVEGDDDCKIYPKFFQKDKCRIEQVHGGYSQMEAAIEKFQQYADRIIGIRDADFCHITQIYAQYKNFFYTDCHDIEMTMIQNNTVFENILHEYSLQTESVKIKENILLESSFVGCVRYFNEINNCSINFEGIAFGNIVEQLPDHSLSLQKPQCLEIINQRSPNKTETLYKNTINQFILSNRTIDLFQLVNGHDFIKLLALRINFQISQKIKDKDVSKSLRNSYRIEDFCQTNLYKCILSWQNTYNRNILIV
jgi:hypothetical protein